MTSRRPTRRRMRRYYPVGGFSRRLLLLPEYRCAFVKNAKAGTSTLTLWLQRIHTGDPTWRPQIDVHEEHTVPRPQDVGWPAMTAALAGDSFRFTFVREPLRRLESAYLNKVHESGAAPLADHVRELAGLPAQAPVEIEDFVEALEACPPIELNPHWRPQHLNLMHGLLEFDLVGHLESFARDLERVREAVGFPHVPLETLNTTSGRRSSLFDTRPGLARRVRDLYALDYELYGY